jgi:hypothetical protein
VVFRTRLPNSPRSSTLAGIISALKSFQEELRDHNITIWVRRAGPNYQEGLKIIREVGIEIRVPIKVGAGARRGDVVLVSDSAVAVVRCTGQRRTLRRSFPWRSEWPTLPTSPSSMIAQVGDPFLMQPLLAM